MLSSGKPFGGSFQDTEKGRLAMEAFDLPKMEDVCWKQEVIKKYALRYAQSAWIASFCQKTVRMCFPLLSQNQLGVAWVTVATVSLAKWISKSL